MLGKRAEGDELRSFDMAEIPLAGLAHVDELEIISSVELLLDLDDRHLRGVRLPAR